MLRSLSSMSLPSVMDLGPEPSMERIDEWFEQWGRFNRTVVGTSLLGRDLILYETMTRSTTSPPSGKHQTVSILFLSLVHANEPTGLFSLLWTVHELLTTSTEIPVRLLFFPIVNVDAYVDNVNFGQGCRRTNLNNKTRCTTVFHNFKNAHCPKVVKAGVDLNRNFPTIDWNENNQTSCGYTYPGDKPFSEPETQAIRTVVESVSPRLQAAVSFHSRGSDRFLPLLIHPFTSKRSMDDMPTDRKDRYRRWRSIMNNHGTKLPRIYGATGTALEAIEYSASGTTIDWLETVHNCTAFVIEVQPPCSQRWCTSLSRHQHETHFRVHGRAAKRMVTLVVAEQLGISVSYVFDYGWEVAIVGMVVLVLRYCYYRRRTRKWGVSMKDVSDADETEMVRLHVT